MTGKNCDNKYCDQSQSRPSNEARRAELHKIYQSSARTPSAVAPPKDPQPSMPKPPKDPQPSMPKPPKEPQPPMPKPAPAMLVFSAEDVAGAKAGAPSKGFGRPAKERAAPPLSVLALNVVSAPAAKPPSTATLMSPFVSRGSTKGQRLDFDCTEKRVALVALELGTSMLADPPAAGTSTAVVYGSSTTTPETSGAPPVPDAPAKPRVAKRSVAGADFQAVVDADVVAEVKRSRTAPAAARPAQLVRFQDPPGPAPLVRTDSVSQLVHLNSPAARRMRRRAPTPAAVERGTSSVSQGSSSLERGTSSVSQGSSSLERKASSVSQGRPPLPQGTHPLARAAVAIMLDPFYSMRMPYFANPPLPAPESPPSPSPEDVMDEIMERNPPPSEVFDEEYDPESPPVNEEYDPESPPVDSGADSVGSAVYDPERPASDARAGSASSGASGASSGTVVWSRDPLYSPGDTDLNETPERDDGLGSPRTPGQEDQAMSSEEPEREELEPDEQEMNSEEPERKMNTEEPERKMNTEEPEREMNTEEPEQEKLDHGVVTPTTAYIQSFMRRADSRQMSFPPEVSTDAVAERAKAAAAVAGARDDEDVETSAAYLVNYATSLDDELGDLISAAATVSAAVDVAKDKFGELRALLVKSVGEPVVKIPAKSLALAVESVKFGHTTLQAMRTTVRVANLSVETAEIALDTVEGKLKDVLQRFGAAGGAAAGGSGAAAGGSGAAGGGSRAAAGAAAGGSRAAAGPPRAAAGAAAGPPRAAAGEVRVEVIPDSEEDA